MTTLCLLVLASTYPRWPGDPEPGFVHELSRRLTAGFRVIVLCPHAPGAKRREVMDGVEVVRYRYAPQRLETMVNDGGIVTNLRRSPWKCLLVPFFVLAQAWAVWRILRRERVDVIHAHWLLPQGLIAQLMRWRPGRKSPYVVTSHGADLYALKGRLLDRLKSFVARHAYAVTVVSSAMRERMLSLGVDRAGISVMPMGVDLSTRFTPDPATPRSQYEILFVGRLVEKKGLKHLIAALPMVLEEVPQAVLTIAGFGPEEAELRQQVRALDLEGQVRVLGAVKQEDRPALYDRAVLFVAPFVQANSGDQEGLGLVLVEAIGCGCPVLVGRVPAVTDVLGEEFSHLLVDPTDASTLTRRVISVLVNSDHASAEAPALRAALADRFDWSRVSARYAELLSAAAMATRE